MDEVESAPMMVDLLIVGGPVMTMDGQDRIIDPGAVAIDGERIVFVGDADEARKRFLCRRTIDGAKKLTMPGLVDTYSHAGHGLAKAVFHATHGWPSNLINFHGTTEAWWAAEAALTACERVRFGVTTGVTTLGATPARTDHERYALANARSVRDVGIRGFVGVGPPDVFVKHIPEPYTVTDYDAQGWPSTRSFTYEDTMVASAAFVRACRAEFDPSTIRPFFASPYVFGRHPKREGKDSDPTYLPEHLPELRRRAEEARAFADEHGVLIHTHMFRSTIDFAVQAFGRPFVDEVLGGDVVVAHANAMGATEIAVLAETGTKVASSPSTGENFWYGRCPVPEMLEAGVNVSIATDGNAPRFSMDLFKDLYRALFLAWVAHGHQQVMPVGKALRMVTAEAAQVIGMDDQIGSLEVGKLADVILIDLNRPHLVPSDHLPNLVAYYVNGNDVDTTIVNGRVLMEGGVVVSVDLDDVIETARHEARLAFERIDISKYLETSRRYWRDASYE
jgi:cytosine/adenosine deaminase-related metal-dependent hydrolase